MSHRRHRIVAYLGFLVSLALAGCGRSGDGSQSPPAAINGTSTASPTAEGNHQPAPAPDLQHPEVVIETTLGKMTVQLDAKNAPLTVENFLRYVNAGEYDQTIVHQVYKGQVFLAGGYGKDFVEKPARTAILSEADNGLKNLRGTIAMARLADGFHTATRQFFVNVADNPNLDYKDHTLEGYGYCVFGKVTDGMDVVDRIANAKVHDERDFDRTPDVPIVITSIRQVH